VAYAKDKKKQYEVTITNITRGQILSPPIVISHNKDFQLFSLGGPATPGLAELAEDGMTATLEAELDALDSVYQYKTPEPPGPPPANFIMPGASLTVVIETKGRFRYLSAASMMVSTNDAFWAIRGAHARRWATMVIDARAYDAGSEVNSEDCAFIPGPPCGSGGVRDTEGAEGYVYIHSGIHGNVDLDPAEADWNNPVAIIKIQKVK
jgi:hypothetical protein